MRIHLLTALAAVAASLPAPDATAAPVSPALASPTVAIAQKGKKKAPKGYHQDTRYGFKFKKPSDFRNIAVKVEEEWMAAKYVCSQQFTYTNPDIGWTGNHYPEFKVIALPRYVLEGRNEVIEDDDGGEVIKLASRYKDYDDMLRQTFTEGGYYESDVKETKIDGIDVTQKTYLAEKGAYFGPLTISTWIYHTEDVDYAVEAIGLTNHWDAIEKLIKPVRSTFEIIEKDAPLKINAGLEFRVNRAELEVKDEKEAKSAAVKSEKVMHERAIAKLPEDWDHKLKGRVLTVYSADKKFANRVQKHSNNLLDWLDSNFGYLGETTYLRKPIIRICRDDAEYFAYVAGINSGSQGGGWYVTDELVTRWDTDGWSGQSVNRLNSQIYDFWMQEKNFSLKTSLPGWIDFGLERLVENSRLDSRKPDWRYDVNLITYAKGLARGGEAVQIEDLFHMTTKDLQDSAQGAGNPFADGALLINYLASPEMKRHKLAKGLLENYLRNMLEVIAVIEKEQKRKLDAARNQARKGDGEREYAALRRQIFEKMEKRMLQETFDKTFEGWTEKDWKTLNAHFRNAF